MKKLFIIFCSALAFAACNKAVENSLSSEGNSAGRIVFRTAEATKSVTESTASVLQTDGFKVAAVTGTTTFFNENVSYVSENAWFETAQTYYYPSVNTNFFAVYPKTQAISIDGTGAATLEYASDNNTDLIAAKALDVVSRETPQPLTFDHILSQVVIKCQGADANAEYVVKSVTLSNTDAATYAYSTGAWTGANKAKASAIVSSNTAASTSSFTTMGEAVTAVPAEMDLRVTWDCLQGSTVVGSYDETVSFTPTIGKVCTVNCTLPNKEAKVIRFTISVNPWGSEDMNITMETEEQVTFAGLQIVPGPLYYNGTSYEIKDSWNYDSFYSVYGKVSGSYYFNFIELGQLFEKADFSTSDGNIENLLDPLDGWRLPTQTELAAIVGTSRAGSTVNGSAGKHYALIKLTGVTHAGSSTPNGLLIFPDGKSITGKTLSGMDNTTQTAGVTESELNAFLAQGCVFLPASGYYADDDDWLGGGISGSYQSSTERITDVAYYLFLNGNNLNAGFSGNKVYDYYSVRLVK